MKPGLEKPEVFQHHNPCHRVTVAFIKKKEITPYTNESCSLHYLYFIFACVLYSTSIIPFDGIEVGIVITMRQVSVIAS